MQPAEGQSRSLRDYHMIRNTKWDLVIGSDLVYNDMGVEWLPRVSPRLPLAVCLFGFFGRRTRSLAGRLSEVHIRGDINRLPRCESSPAP